MNQFSFFILSILVIFFVLFFCPVAQGGRAQPLLRFNPEKKSYELNRSFRSEIAKLPAPIRVIAMIGGARNGKSTTLNVVNHIWTGKNRTSVEEVFQTGDSLAPVTRGAWAYVTQHENGSIVLLDVEAADLGDETLVAHLHMFTAVISSGLSILVRDHVQHSELESLLYMARLTELVFPNSSCDNFPKVGIVVRGGVEKPGNQSFEDYTRDSVMEKFISKCFPRSKIAISQIPNVIDRGLFNDFEKLSQSGYMTSVEGLAAELEKFPIKRSLEGSPMDGVALAELIERLAETIGADEWLDFANVYNIIESNICKRSEAKLVAPVFHLKSEQIELEKDNILDALERECRLENGFASARDKLQRIIQAKKSLEDMKMILAEYENKKMVEEEKIANREEEFRNIIAEKDQELTQEIKLRQGAEQKAQDLLQKLNTCELRLKEEIERGWMWAFRAAFIADIPGGAELLYNQRQKTKAEKPETNCSKMFDEIEQLKEELKRIVKPPETTYSIREFSEALIQILGLCSSVLKLALQIRGIYRQPAPN